MEDVSESSVVQCEENKAAPEKHKGRQFKSREQLQGLENFYNEHNYPTESMKAEIAIKLNLTEKQVSGWFCHRRLKDKRLLKEESQAPRRQDLSSGIIQDRASGLKQDSCSSTKYADYKRADLREVESRRYCHENLPVVELNYLQRSLGDGTERDDTSSESNSALQESVYPQNWSNLAAETSEYRASNGFIQPSRGHVGPSGYLKIKCQMENAAITAVKRQLGRHYWEDGPSLGIEFDPLPPEAFDLSSKNINDDAYGLPEPIGLHPHDISGIHKYPGLSTMRNENLYEAPEDMQLHRSNPDNFSFRKPKQKLPFPNNSRGFPDQKPSFGIDSYNTREFSDYNSSRNLNIHRKHDMPGGMRSDFRLDHPPHAYGGKVVNDPKGTFLPDYDNVNPKVVRQREHISSGPAAPSFWHKDPIYKEDRLPSHMIMKNEEAYVGRRPTSEHNDLINSKMRPTNEFKANKRGREGVLEDDYPIRTSFQDPALWSKQMKRPTEMPSSFSEDETAETSSSMD